MNLNELAQRVHKANIKWWQDPVTKERIERNKGELLMLVITELAEACEGERKNLMDDKLPHRRMAEVEMADAFIRLLDFSAGFGYLIKRLNMIADISNKGEFLFNICRKVGQVNYFKQGELSFKLSEIITMIYLYCEKFDYDLVGAFEEKMAYNTTRQDHQHEARLQAGGKQW